MRVFRDEGWGSGNHLVLETGYTVTTGSLVQENPRSSHWGESSGSGFVQLPDDARGSVMLRQQAWCLVSEHPVVTARS